MRAISAWPEGNQFLVNFERFITKVNAEGRGLVQTNYLGRGAKVMPPFEVGNAVKNGVPTSPMWRAGFTLTYCPSLTRHSLTPRQLPTCARMAATAISTSREARRSMCNTSHVWSIRCRFIYSCASRSPNPTARGSGCASYPPTAHSSRHSARSRCSIFHRVRSTPRSNEICSTAMCGLRSGLFAVGIEKQTKYRVDRSPEHGPKLRAMLTK